MKRPLFVIFCLLCIGIGLWYPRNDKEDPTFSQGTSYPVSVSGIVSRYDKKAHSVCLTLTNCRILYEKKTYRCDKLLLYLKEDYPGACGDCIAAQGKLTSFSPDRNPGNMDWQLYYASQHISYRVNVSSFSLSPSSPRPIQNFFLTFRYTCISHLDQMVLLGQKASLPFLSEESAGVLKALLLGTQQDLSEETRNLYESAGILSILSISGLHILLLGNSLLSLCKCLRLGSRFATAVSACILFGYWWMIGLKPSAFRAVLLFLCLHCAPFFGRSYDRLSATSLAGILLLLNSPLLLFQSSFQLSFGAVMAMDLYVPLLASPASLSVPYQWNPIRARLSRIYRLLCSSLVLQLFLLPLLLYHFFRFPLYGLFSSLLLLPLSSPLLLFGLLGLGLSFICLPAGLIFLFPCQGILWIYQTICSAISSLPFASPLLGRPSLWRIFLYEGVLFLILKIRNDFHISENKKRRPLSSFTANNRYSLFFRFLSGAVLCILPLLLFSFPNKQLAVTFLDVGQGDCAWIRTPEGKNILIDGGSSDISSVSSDRILPFLESQGVSSLDYVFLSHPDADHTNGVHDLIASGYPIGTVLLPVLSHSLSQEPAYQEELSFLQDSGVPFHFFQKGDCLREGELILSCLAPEEEVYYASLNDASLVLSLSYQGFGILFTGDCSEGGEENLLRTIRSEGLWKSRNSPSYVVLKVGHHGSKYSTGSSLLKALQPRMAVISCGIHNSYGHPHEETLERLIKAGVDILRTDQRGAIQFLVKEGRLTIIPYVK